LIILGARSVAADMGAGARLSGVFRRHHCVALPGLLDASLLEQLRPRLANGPWREKLHAGVGAEAVLDDSRALGLLQLAANTPALIEAVRTITGCAAIGYFHGRVYRLTPGAGHHDSWHDDVLAGRRVGMSINLGEAHEGGVFELRACGTGREPIRMPNPEPGSAILFRIAPQLEHRVSAVTGVVPKTAFAGWFCSGMPDLLSRLHALPAAAPAGDGTPARAR
jgi:hypothetical protein